MIEILTQDGGADEEAEGDAQECGESLEELEMGRNYERLEIPHRDQQSQYRT